MAVQWCGRLADIAHLERGDCPQGATQIDEGETLDEVVARSLRAHMPMAVAVGALSAVRIAAGLNWQSPVNIGRVGLCIAAFIVLYALLIFVHEGIHALFYPRHAVKEVWIYEWSAALVYCNVPISRERFMAMCLAPAVLLGFVPFVLWLLWGNEVPVDLSVLWMTLS